MLLQRLQPPLRTAITSIARSGASQNPQKCLNEAFAQLAINPTPIVKIFVRHASHKAQGAVNKAKDGPGKRLGAKKSGEQYVIPGNIIFRQRGTHWFPGENCAMGRDHTIYATECGYVKYYKDPERHPKRQYIGVVFERDQTLPVPRNAIRRRRLGLVPTKMQPVTTVPENVAIEGAELMVETEGDRPPPPPKPITQVTLKPRKGEKEERVLKLVTPGYMFRETNWDIGRAAERAKVKVKLFKPRDRWTAWRKANVRKAKNSDNRTLGRLTKKR